MPASPINRTLPLFVLFALSLICFCGATEAADVPDMKDFPRPSRIISGDERAMDDWWPYIDAVGWGRMVYLDDALPWYRDTVIKPAHERGVAYIGSISTADPEVAMGPEIGRLLEDARVKDIDGNPIGRNNYCIASDDYYNFELEYTKRSIDQGMDGIIIDEPEGVGVYRFCYCTSCISKFRNYLKSNYTAAHLKKNWDINDVSTFNHRLWLSDLSDTQADENKRYKLQQAYKTFSEDLSLDFQSRLMSEAKEYTMSKHGRYLYTTLNLKPICRWGYLISQHLSSAYYEYKGHEPLGDMYPAALRPGLPPKTSSVVVQKLFDALGLAVVLQNQIDLMTTGEIDPSGNLIKPTLKRIIQAEITAAGGNYKAHNGSWSPTLDGIYEDTKITGRDYLWILKNAFLLDDFKPVACEFALIINTPMMKHEPQFLQVAYWGAAHLLLRTHRPFEVLLWGDGSEYPDNISIKTLTEYKAVLLPNLTIITDSMIETLIRYVARGGCLILLEPCGRLDENLKPRNNQTWTDVTSKTTAYQKGQVIMIDSDFGTFRYKGAPDMGPISIEDPDLGTHYILTLSQEDLDLFDKTLSEHIEPDFQTDLSQNIILAAQKIKFPVKDVWLQTVDLVNNDYDFETDTNKPHSGYIICKLPHFNGKDTLAVEYLPFTFDESASLDYEILHDNKIKIQIPPINIWSLISIKPNMK
jgi:hypothetical protein